MLIPCRGGREKWIQVESVERDRGSRNRIIAALVLALAVIFLLLPGGCGSKTSHPASLRIGVVLYDSSDTFLGAMMDDFQAYASEEKKKQDFGISVSVRDAKNSQSHEDDQVNDLLDDGYNLLCVNLVDRTVPSNIINAAKEKNVPVIFFNREPVKEDLKLWDKLYYVGMQSDQAGQMQGELAADYIRSHDSVDKNHDGKIQYVMLEGQPGHQDAIIRSDNVVRTLQSEGIVLDKESYQIANWNRSQAQTKMIQLFGTYGNQIELVLSNNDDMALGAIDAYDKLNITEANRPVIFGIDGTDDGLKAVADGELAGTVYNNKEGMAKDMLKMAVALYKGDDLKKFDLTDGIYKLLPYQKVTADNLREFLNRGVS